MNQPLPTVYLARHGEIDWTISGQYTGLTDLPLTARGERNARQLGERLKGVSFAEVLTSPLQRAARTCDLAGFGEMARVEKDLVEWNYGDYEGRRSVEIHAERPEWNLFRDGCPGGETPEQVGARADCVLQQLRPFKGDILLFSSGHFLRVLAARWLGLEPAAGRFFLLNTASLSALSFEHNLSEPAIRLWDEVQHVVTEALTECVTEDQVISKTKAKDSYEQHKIQTDLHHGSTQQIGAEIKTIANRRAAHTSRGSAAQ